MNPDKVLENVLSDLCAVLVYNPEDSDDPNRLQAIGDAVEGLRALADWLDAGGDPPVVSFHDDHIFVIGESED